LNALIAARFAITAQRLLTLLSSQGTVVLYWGTFYGFICIALEIGYIDLPDVVSFRISRVSGTRGFGQE
jgi:hypothetical protein